MHPLLRLIRLNNTVVSFAGTLVGGFAARGAGLGGGAAVFVALLLAATSTACVTAGGNVLNDLRDRESDRVNHPDRPLVTGAISMGSARRLVIGLLVFSVLLIVPIALAHPWVPVILATALTAVLAYEFRWKSRGLPGNALVAYLTAAVFLYGAAAVGETAVVAVFAVLAFLATLSREIIKDMEDAEGDVGRLTLPRVYGMGLSAVAARLAVAGAIALSPVPVLTFLPWGSAAAIMYLALVVAADALFVASVASLPRQLHRGQTLSKGAMSVALLAFLATAFR
ncbi:MAG: UbiA family prenyltransferase [Thermoplasmata archaeon]|nr:UbiA family prenyltransferase [Thermoplasmata archaeon]